MDKYHKKNSCSYYRFPPGQSTVYSSYQLPAKQSIFARDWDIICAPADITKGSDCQSVCTQVLVDRLAAAPL